MSTCSCFQVAIISNYLWLWVAQFKKLTMQAPPFSCFIPAGYGLVNTDTCVVPWRAWHSKPLKLFGPVMVTKGSQKAKHPQTRGASTSSTSECASDSYNNDTLQLAFYVPSLEKRRKLYTVQWGKGSSFSDSILAQSHLYDDCIGTVSPCRRGYVCNFY